MKGITMKKTLLFVALTLLSASAFASKARVAVVGVSNSKADDVQDVFVNPAKMFGFSDMLTIEYGAAGNEEGGIFRSHGDAKYGVYLGHKSPGFARLTTIANTAGLGLLTEQNPFELFYGQKNGDMRYAASLVYSNAENKTNNRKTSTTGIRLGAATDVWEAYLGLGLMGEAKNSGTPATSAKNDMSVLVGGQYAVSDLLYYGSVDQSSGKINNGTTDTKLTYSLITVGVESKTKGDASHFFYGLKYNMLSTKAASTPEEKTTTSNLPLYAGIEADAATWLVLRGSVQQSVLINNNKVEGATPSETSGLNDTTAALGAGFKFGKMFIDTSLAAGGGTMSSVDFGTQASLNYTW